MYGIFAVYVGFMLCLSAFGTKEFYNIDYNFGQKDLIEFAQYTKDNNKSLGAIDLGRKYSLLYYYGGKVNYYDSEEIKDLPIDEYIVIRTRDVEDLKIPYEVIKIGRKFSLIKGI